MHFDNITILKETTAEFDSTEINTNLPTMLVISSFVFGLLIAVIVVIIQEFYFTKLNSSRQVEKELNIPVLGVVPTIKSKTFFYNNRDEFDGKIISKWNSPTVLVEQFNKIRANVQFIMSQKNIKAILVISSVVGDGKSVISGNLAISMAMAGKKTIFVDINLRNRLEGSSSIYLKE